MMGRVGPTELVAVAIGTGLWHVLFLFALGILMALSPSVAQLNGAGRITAIAPLGPWLGLIAGLTVAAVLLNLRFWRLSARLG